MENAPPKLLIVEDEPGLALGLRDNFEFEGFAVFSAADGEEALRIAFREKPDLVLLDLMLPKLTGFEVCRQLREAGAAMPIVMLTARSQEADVVKGLELGADDYVTKPFSIRELIARVRAHLRRAAPAQARLERYEFGGMSFDFRNYAAHGMSGELILSPREFELLRYLVTRRGEVVTREELLEQVWGIQDYPMTRTVDNHIGKLRQKIEAEPGEPKWIVTVHRSGYKFLG
ncbi:MAG: response regulator transcription factor [Candidatus Solibacter usitatus]|nr:response regulator transcription factor [Candidatus Solibacter usitatus]